MEKGNSHHRVLQQINPLNLFCQRLLLSKLSRGGGLHHLNLQSITQSSQPGLSGTERNLPL